LDLKEIIPSSITARNERDNSVLNNGMTCDVVYRQNSLTICYCCCCCCYLLVDCLLHCWGCLR